MINALKSCDGNWLKDAIASIYFKKNQKNFESVESVLDYINRYLCVDTKWVGEIEALVIMVLYDVKVKVLTWKLYG